MYHNAEESITLNIYTVAYSMRGEVSKGWKNGFGHKWNME